MIRHFKSRLLVALFLSSLFILPRTSAQRDVLGVHDLSPNGPSPVKGSSSAACVYCHAPHSGVGGSTPLWNQTLSTQSYTTYTSTGLQNPEIQPVAGGASSLCLSCHDGTVAVGQSAVAGRVPTTGSMTPPDMFGSHLETSHPFSMAVTRDAASLVATLATTHATADMLKKVALIKGSVECNSCHDPHIQSVDPNSPNFLVRDASSGQLCLACHTATARSVNGKQNPLVNWNTSVHATSGNGLTGQVALGGYSTVAQTACMSCHAPHNATTGSGLLRAAQPTTNLVTDGSVQSCLTCHNGSNVLQAPIANVMAEMTKTTPNGAGGHPLPSSTNFHDMNEAAVEPNRHAGCADCHNPHQATQVATFGPAPAIRQSQNGVVGVEPTTGVIVNPAVSQYQLCLRCHGTSQAKQSLLAYGYLPSRMAQAADPLNVTSEFLSSATSKHPVFQPNSGATPTSLRQFMLNLDGTTNSSRSLGVGISLLCTDCHNSDDNREFGGSGPNGPHGSQYWHMLERRYELSQAATPGGPITQNLTPNPSLTSGGPAQGPYALCGKCHDLTQLVGDSFGGGGGNNRHNTHVVNVGVSCSVCHAGHGLGAVNPNLSGDHLVNFDLKVVGPNKNGRLSYNGGSRTCNLSCHGKDHDNQNY